MRKANPARRRDDGGRCGGAGCANRVRPAELELETVITSFAERFDTWLAAARRASIEAAENDDACPRGRLRRVAGPSSRRPHL